MRCAVVGLYKYMDEVACACMRDVDKCMRLCKGLYVVAAMPALASEEVGEMGRPGGVGGAVDVVGGAVEVVLV